jgi:hypothetical protein
MAGSETIPALLSLVVSLLNLPRLQVGPLGGPVRISDYYV